MECAEREIEQVRPAATQLYPGLLHHDDDAGDKARIAVARRFVDNFGLAAECG